MSLRLTPLFVSGAILLQLLLCGCSERVALLNGIQASGELRIATIAGNTTFRRGDGGYAGFEHDLSAAFADWLGVEPRFVVARDYGELRQLVASGRAHLGAGLLPVQQPATPGLRYGPSYAVGRQWVIHRRDQPRPRRLNDLRSWRGATIAGRGAVPILEQEIPRADGYRWSVFPDLAIADLLRKVDDGALDYAVLPSFDFEARRRYYPELRVAFEIGVPQAVAWLYRAGTHNSLGAAQREFLRDIRETGALSAIRERYFGHVDDFDYVESRAFLRHYAERLPQYRDLFSEVAAQNDIDWRLLAAVSYQESHWRKDARSPTGVRGLMMLTRRTARQLKVDRLDPAQSIDGGARYFLRMKARLPARIEEPDRTYLALAAYNVGLGHLEDARVFTARAGRNPDVWEDVREFLPRLGNREWARQARHGYARGFQAVHFVGKVREYYAMLRWLDSDRLTADSRLLPPPPDLVSPVL